MEQEGVKGVVRDEDVGASIVVVVGHAYAHTLADGTANTPRLGNILESPVALINVKFIGQALVGSGVAVLRKILVPAARLFLIVPLHVDDDAQIEQAVVIHVNPGRCHGPVRAIYGIGTVQAGLDGYIGERAVPVVPVERVVMDSGDKQIGIPVIVEVADSHAHVVASAGESRLYG